MVELRMTFAVFLSVMLFLPLKGVLCEHIRKACGCKCYSPPINAVRIIGGIMADLHEFPFMALLTDGIYTCGGSVITRIHILTAAHCLVEFLFTLQINDKEHDHLTIHLGMVDIDAPVVKRKGVELLYHHEYNKSTYENDIGIVKMDVPLDFNEDVRPACLPWGTMSTYYRLAVVSGWGLTSEDGYTSNHLLKTYVPFVKQELCSNFYSVIDINITQNMLCAADIGKDSCRGDSGGPLLAEAISSNVTELIGIVSFGYGCANEKFPGVYTNVARYLDWIRRNILPDCLCTP